MELSEHVVDFEKRTAIISHIMANFVAEWTEPGSHNVGIILESLWFVYCDRARGSTRARAPVVLISPPE
jgi:hypothetical protein